MNEGLPTGPPNDVLLLVSLQPCLGSRQLRRRRLQDDRTFIAWRGFVLEAAAAKLSGPEARLEGDKQKDIIWWTGGKTFIQWLVPVSHPGSYWVVLNYSLFGKSNGAQLAISVGDQTLRAMPKSGGGTADFQAGNVGEVKIGTAGDCKITLKPASKPGHEYVIKVRSVELRPANQLAEGPDISGVVKPSAAGVFKLTAADVQIDGMNARLGSANNQEKKIQFWQDIGTSLAWTIDVRTSGKFRVELDYSQSKDEQGAKLLVKVGDQMLKVQPRPTKSWGDYLSGNAGEVTIDKPGLVPVVLTPVSRPHDSIVDLRSVTLVPAETPTKAIDIVDSPISAAADGSFTLGAAEAELDGESSRLEGGANKYVVWRSNRDRLIRWPVKIDRPGTYRVALTYSMESDDRSEVTIKVAGQELSRTLLPGLGLDDFKTVDFGEVNINPEGNAEAVMESPKEIGTLVLHLQSVMIVPAKKF